MHWLTLTQTYTRYNDLLPARLQVGDVVTLQISFVLVPIKPDGHFRFRLLNVLRAVTLMSNELTKVIMAALYALHILISFRLLFRSGKQCGHPPLVCEL
jgi:hypothetical protein